jgi:hypothetical protein
VGSILVAIIVFGLIYRCWFVKSIEESKQKKSKRANKEKLNPSSSPGGESGYIETPPNS